MYVVFLRIYRSHPHHIFNFGVLQKSFSSYTGIDVPLLAYFFFWYLGNYYYNITNKLALKAAGGKTGFPMTIASLQVGVS